MKILVSDTSVLLDLERGDLLDACFHLPYEFAVPDLLYNKELANFGGPELIARGLRIEELTGDEVAAAQHFEGYGRCFRCPMHSPMRLHPRAAGDC